MNDIVPFGKYKGQPVEVLAQDRNYCDWLARQDWFRARFAAIHTLIINNFGAPEETPEHNALQALFTDDKWTLAFVITYAGGRQAIRDKAKRVQEYERADQLEHLREKLQDAEKVHERDDNRFAELRLKPSPHFRPDWERSWEDSGAKQLAKIEQLKQEIAEVKDAPFELDMTMVLNSCDFESRGADVVVDAYTKPRSDYWHLRIECKPVVGDDYPAVLRQMRANDCNVLLIGEGGYTGTGATLEQVTTMFASAGIRIVHVAGVQ